MAQYFGLKAEIAKKAHQHGYKSDIAAFMAAEQLAAKENELREMMIYQGRGGMWDDWLSFQAEMKRSRDEQEKTKIKEKLRRRAIVVGIAMWTGVSIAGMMLAISAVYITLAILKYT